MSTTTTPSTTDFDRLPDGRPTAPHRWEQQFKVKGERARRPPPEKLAERIRQLEQAIADATAKGGRPQDGWLKELDWRKRQLAS